jgi:hypothetical protein
LPGHSAGQTFLARRLSGIYAGAQKLYAARPPRALEPSLGQREGFFMKAMVLAMAARVGESEFARWWRAAAAVLDCVIPLVLLIMIVASLGSIWFGYVQ